MNAIPRYLTPFHPKRVPHYFTDILILGGGLAGQRAALAIEPSQSVLIITKDSVDQSNSNWAQGGIAGVLDPEDRLEDHVADTLTAGGALCDREVVEMVCREAPGRIQELIDWGTQFDTADGRLLLGREGGHGHQRIVHALGDATGKEIMRAVLARVRELPNLQIWEDSFTIDLLTSDGACRGALIWNPQHGRTLIWAKQTILATGGCGQLYRESTNPSVATADGHAMALRAGVQLRDMEFMQFHPTVLYIAGTSRSLITEAVRGEGARLLDRRGHRFMLDYDERAELAPRDVVSQAIVRQMEKTRYSNVFLDLSHLDSEFVRRRFPGFCGLCQRFGIDIASQRIPVRPGAHYMLGGVKVSLDGQTSLPGLWAAGEATSSGLHGANRLASNSLLEAIVYGARAGAGASAVASDVADRFRAWPVDSPAAGDLDEPLDLGDIRNSLKSVMWRSVGVERSGHDLEDARDSVASWRNYVRQRQFSRPEGWELQNMLLVAQAMIAAALVREESRGVHYRTDFPEPNDAQWLRRSILSRDDAGELRIVRE